MSFFNSIIYILFFLAKKKTKTSVVEKACVPTSNVNQVDIVEESNSDQSNADDNDDYETDDDEYKDDETDDDDEDSFNPEVSG